MTAEGLRAGMGIIGIGQAVRLAAFVIVGAWMFSHVGEPPPPPSVHASECRGCGEERRAMAKWEAATDSQRWQCRSAERAWSDVEDCLGRAGERAAADPWPWSR